MICSALAIHSDVAGSHAVTGGHGAGPEWRRCISRSRHPVLPDVCCLHVDALLTQLDAEVRQNLSRANDYQTVLLRSLRLGLWFFAALFWCTLGVLI